jgi:putative hydrolase of the HAD superfamily
MLVTAVRPVTDFDAILFDAGGILLLPDPTVLGPLLAPYGGDPSIAAHVRAHYRAMAVKSWAGSGETFWDEYNLAYCESIGIPDDDVHYAAKVLERTRSAYLWRWPIPESVEALGRFAEAGIPMGVVSNASGQIEDVLLRSRVCQLGRGVHTEMRVIVDSHHVGVAKPDPRIFDFAVPAFEGIDVSRIAFIGDSVTMDIGGGSAAGLHAILLDPYDDHPEANFPRIRSLHDLLPR